MNPDPTATLDQLEAEIRNLRRQLSIVLVFMCATIMLGWTYALMVKHGAG